MSPIRRRAAFDCGFVFQADPALSDPAKLTYSYRVCHQGKIYRLKNGVYRTPANWADHIIHYEVDSSGKTALVIKPFTRTYGTWATMECRVDGKFCRGYNQGGRLDEIEIFDENTFRYTFWEGTTTTFSKID